MPLLRSKSHARVEEQRDQAREQVLQLKKEKQEEQMKKDSFRNSCESLVEAISQCVREGRENESSQDQTTQNLAKIVGNPESKLVMDHILKLPDERHRWTLISTYCLGMVGIKNEYSMEIVDWCFKNGEGYIKSALNYVWDLIQKGVKWVCESLKGAYNWLCLIVSRYTK